MIKKELSDKIKYLIMLAFVTLLPFSKKAIPVIIGLWVIVWLIEARFATKLKQLFKSPQLLLLILFYLLHIVGLLYTKNMKSGLFDIEVKMSLFIIPIIILDNKLLSNKKYFNNLLRIFILSTFISVIVCFSQALYHYIINDDWRLLYYYNFSIFHHTSYFSLYLMLSISMIFYLFIKKEIKGTILSFVYSIFLIFFLMGIYYASSRSAIITLIFLLIFISIYIAIKSKRKWISLVLFILLGSSIITTINVNNRFAFYFQNSGKLISDLYNNDLTKSNDERFQIWGSAIEVVKENIIFGVGTGDVKDNLFEKYKKNNLNKLVESSFNVHNQILENFVILGLIGGILFLIILFYPLVVKPELLYSMFFIIILSNFIFESMLNTQAGVTFFAFFFSLFVLYKKREKTYN